MIPIPPGLLGADLDFGAVRITADSISAYAAAVGDRATLSKPIEQAPPTFCLSLHRGMRPEIELPPDYFSVYGGHDIEFRQPLRAELTYHIHARLTDVYEKSGRSGTLTVIVREARIENASGQVAVRITERQIVRKKRQGMGDAGVAIESQQTGAGEWESVEHSSTNPHTPTFNPQIGDELEPRPRPGPSAAQISAYAATIGAREGIFTHPGRARNLGFSGVVVPGPMLSAFLEQFLRARFSGWRIEKLSVTFRVPTTAATPLLLHGVVTEKHETADGVRIVCDVVIEHGDGERAVAGTATLQRDLG